MHYFDDQSNYLGQPSNLKVGILFVLPSLFDFVKNLFEIHNKQKMYACKKKITLSMCYKKKTN